MSVYSEIKDYHIAWAAGFFDGGRLCNYFEASVQKFRWQEKAFASCPCGN